MKKPEVEKILHKKQAIMMAVAAGVSVANIYFNQPILKNIATSLHVSEAKAGSIATLTQIGYGLGLFFIIPLGDKVNKKNLILTLLLMLSVVLIIMSLAYDIVTVWVLSVAIGILSVSPQVLLPMAAGLDNVNRGKTVGIVFSGVLTGMLSARVFSGFIAGWLGWRYVYGISSVMVLLAGLMLKIKLPDVKDQYAGTYLHLLRSTVSQIKRFALLREAALTGALLFGVFCSFWTTLTFHLSSAPFNYSSSVIGLFGLLAIAGAMAAPLFGRLSDNGNTLRSLIVSIILIFISLLLVRLLPLSAVAFVIAVLLIDIGVQMMQVTNLARIYSLDDRSHSRINTVYMTAYFVGGAVGTSVGLWCWNRGGWNLVTLQMLLWSALALGVILRGYMKNRPLAK